jgi:hypothetical protein
VSYESEENFSLEMAVAMENNAKIKQNEKTHVANH